VPELSKIIKFYESEIGLVTKTISDKIISYLDDKTNPQWILDAIRIAVEHNARNWAYIEAILKRWIAQGNQGDMRNSKSENQSLKNIEKWLEKQDAN
jgi:DnaD/phage-associated family protein